ncbi:hypothetical protein V1478_009154, partial [Vespula squamosa]
NRKGRNVLRNRMKFAIRNFKYSRHLANETRKCQETSVRWTDCCTVQPRGCTSNRLRSHFPIGPVCIDKVRVRAERHGTLLPRGSNSPDFLPLTATIATAFAAISANGVRRSYRPGDKIPGKFCETFELGYVEEMVNEWYEGDNNENTEDIEVKHKEENIEIDNTKFLT